MLGAGRLASSIQSLHPLPAAVASPLQDKGADETGGPHRGQGIPGGLQGIKTGQVFDRKVTFSLFFDSSEITYSRRIEVSGIAVCTQLNPVKAGAATVTGKLLGAGLAEGNPGFFHQESSLVSSSPDGAQRLVGFRRIL
jgi:hypothetical protein